jgi:hypothetical protein
MSKIKSLELDLKKYWEIKEIRDSSAFFRELPMLLPNDAILYFEGISVAKDVKLYLQLNSISPNFELPKGTIWPRSAIFHVPINAAFMEGLARMAENHAEPEICDHLQAYTGEKIVLAWFDAFHDPLWLTMDIPEIKVQEFCNNLNAKYERVLAAG